MQRRWFGAVTSFTIDPSLGQTEDLTVVSLDTTNIHSGDTIVRALCGWHAETDLVDNSSGLQLPHLIYKFGFNFAPPPFGEAQFDPGGSGGDSLCKDFTHWSPQNWTDGSLFATKWYASSPGVISVQGQRTIHDKTEDVINLWMKADSASLDSGLVVSAKVYGWMWIEYLVQTIF